jgi:uncharacterized protein
MSTCIPTEPELFRLEGDRAVLLGSRCVACGGSFFPRRFECPVCLVDVQDAELSTQGELYSYTYVRVPVIGDRKLDAVAYGVGQVDLPEGVRVQTVLLGDPASWEIGAAMVSGFEIVGTNEAGSQVAVFRFGPASSGAGK